MFIQASIENPGSEPISLGKKRSAQLLREIFESLCEGAIKFNWQEPTAKSQHHHFEADLFYRQQTDGGWSYDRERRTV